ncbi:hypothetical protein CROQUDRAFT_625635 [Cronartium quercuum f. sp. fusiforme G11]|uniref:Uncharacterized protein n=1 Tax=Cronartium quercuum f. sp. fusiforme G11 TaxID=708437 RepID=A0A9P6T9S1_9BASI|nr:hypothetical protein CROQUDRAFT_625635 [Cronartium quercuum f. sp. fusiforme G11]
MLDNGTLDRLLDMTIDAINLLSAQSWLREMLAFIFAAVHAWWVLLAVELPLEPRTRQERLWIGIWPAIYDIMLPMNPSGGSAVHVVLWSFFCDMVTLMQQVGAYGIHDVIQVLDDQLEESAENDPVRTKILRTRTALAHQEQIIFLPVDALIRQLTNQLFTAVKLKKHLCAVM